MIMGIFTPSNSYKTLEGITVGELPFNRWKVYTACQYMIPQQAVSAGGNLTENEYI